MPISRVIADEGFAPKPQRGEGLGVCAPPLPCETPSIRESKARETVVVPFEDRRLTRTPAEIGEQSALFADLVERIAASADKAAFTRLFAYYAPRVKGYLLRLGMGQAEAEEVSQEVMVAVWRKAATFDRRQASVATWIFRIARNRRIDAFRRDQRAVLDVSDPIFHPEPAAGADQVAETSERETQLRMAVAELPPEQRDLVRVAFYEDLSHSQVAERTGLPLGTVKSRLRLAFAKLKLRLKDDDEDQGAAQ
jgi:RNA polymerase sigma factor (sigma-70 family)